MGKKYQKDFAKKMYLFFLSFDDGSSAPSFAKFARSIGATAEEIEAFRRHREFDRAYRECREIRRDYLIDRALSKRFDGSFVKFLLSESGEDIATDDSLSLRLEVIDK